MPFAPSFLLLVKIGAVCGRPASRELERERERERGKRVDWLDEREIEYNMDLLWFVDLQ